MIITHDNYNNLLFLPMIFACHAGHSNNVICMYADILKTLKARIFRKLYLKKI